MPLAENHHIGTKKLIYTKDVGFNDKKFEVLPFKKNLTISEINLDFPKIISMQF